MTDINQYAVRGERKVSFQQFAIQSLKWLTFSSTVNMLFDLTLSHKEELAIDAVLPI
jgi:hypothetical protein